MKRWISILTVLCLVIALPAGVFAEETSEELRAMEFFDAGKYTEAKKIYNDLGMTDMVNECDYQWAFTQAESNHFQNALYLFEKLAGTGYKNSEELLLQVRYEYVLYLLGTFSTQNYYAAYKNAAELAKTGYPGAEELVDYTISAVFEKGVEYYEAKNYTIAYQLFSVIRSANIDEITHYYALSCIHANMPVSKEEYSILISHLDFADTKEALLSQKVYAEMFLTGEWQETNGMQFAITEDGHLTDELPRTIPESCYWTIRDGVLKVCTDTSKTRINDQVIRIISEGQIEIFCYADGNTYILNRKAE